MSIFEDRPSRDGEPLYDGQSWSLRCDDNDDVVRWYFKNDVNNGGEDDDDDKIINDKWNINDMIKS